MKLQELYGDDFHVDIVTAGTMDFSWDDDDFLKKYDIIHFHRTISVVKDNALQQAYLQDVFPIFDKLKSMGIITVMDLDDYWEPGMEHPAYEMIKRDMLGLKIKENLKKADYVITTTSIFANEISKFNKNVIVLANAIDPSEKQFTPKNESTDKKLRFGWLGGSSHLHDLKLMGENVSRFVRDYSDDSQFVLCGFDTRGSITEIDRNTGEQKTRRINPEESVWARYESIFTNDYKNLKDPYVANLKKYNREFDEDLMITSESYRRVWTKPITTYASNYNSFDVSMAPLKEHMFNKCKSQLKVIEAGFHKKALIAQNFGPYQIDCVNVIGFGGSINEKGNSILIDSNKNSRDWYKAMKKLYENPELVDLMSNNLYDLVNERYHIDVVTKKRAEFYKTIVRNNQTEVKQLIEETNAI